MIGTTIMVIAIAVAVFVISLRLVESDGEVLSAFGVLGVIFSTAFLLIFIFKGFGFEIPVGDPIEVPAIYMRTNNITVATFIVDGEAKVLSSDTAWAYNAGTNEIYVKEQPRANCWDYPMESEYTLERRK